VTAEECRAPFPCDALPGAFDDRYYRGIDIDAPPSLVYRWLGQLRISPYSYDMLDNFGIPSPSRLSTRRGPPAAGERVMHLFRIVSCTRDEQMTVELRSLLGRLAMGYLDGSYVVVPRARGSRLLVKVRIRYPRGPLRRLFVRYMPRLDLYMFKKQLLTLKAYAERDAT
jgi:hypothetical protein